MTPKPFLLFYLIFISLVTYGQEDGISLYNSGKYSESIRYADSLLKTDSTNSKLWYNLGLAQSAVYRFSSAIFSYQQALKYATDSTRLMFVLAQTYESTGQRKQAVEEYKSIIRIDTLFLPAKARLASIYTMQQNYLPAIELYSSLIRQDSTNGYFYSKLAYCCGEIGMIPAAINYYNQAISLNSGDENAANNLVELLIQTRQFEMADSTVNSLLCLFPNSIDLLKDKACIVSTLGFYTEAIALFKQVVEKGDSSLTTCKNFGNTLFNNGNYPEACFWLRRYANDKPDDTDNLFYLALACQRDYRYEEAIGLLDTVLLQIYNTKSIARTFAERGQTYEMYGNYLNFRDSTKTLAASKYKASLADRYQSLQLEPNQFEVNLQLARMYEKQVVDLKKALMHYQNCRNLAPENKELYGNYEWLDSKIAHLKEELHFKGN
jgi:tetratricopeptide (TPR) repeat protein